MNRMCLRVFFLGLSFAGVALAQEAKRPPPGRDDLRKPLELIDEIYVISAGAARAEISRVIADLQGVADKDNTPLVDQYAIWTKIEELAIRIGDAELWRSTIDKRLAIFSVDEWATNTSGLLKFAKKNDVDFIKSTLLDRALVLAEQRSLHNRASEAIAFLEAMGTASTQIAAHGETMRRLQTSIAQIKERDAEQSAYVAAKIALEIDPDDARAHFVIGAYLAVVDDDWGNAIKAFAKGNVNDFALAAKLERDEKQMDETAEAWSRVAKSFTRDFKQTNSLSDAVIQHAIELKETASRTADSLIQKKYQADIAMLSSGLRDRAARSASASTNSKPSASVTSREPTNSESRPMKRIRLARESAAPDAVKIGDHFYKVISRSKVPWHVAAAECQRVGGYLACIETESERQRVVSQFDKPLVLWLGGQVLPNGKLMWLSGVPISQSVLDLKRGYKYVAFTRNGGLNVRPKSGTAPYTVRHIRGYLCESDN